MKLNEKILEKAKAIRLLVLDVDGVLTSGQLYYSAKGEEQKVFHVQDGLGIQLLLKAGIEIAVISGRNSLAVSKRLQELEIKHIFQGQANKLEVYLNLLRQLNLDSHQTACMGDDWPDLPLLQHAGLSIAVTNAVPAVLEKADVCTDFSGGQGAVREIAEFILQAQGKLEDLLKAYG